MDISTFNFLVLKILTKLIKLVGKYFLDTCIYMAWANFWWFLPKIYYFTLAKKNGPRNTFYGDFSKIRFLAKNLTILIDFLWNFLSENVYSYILSFITFQVMSKTIFTKSYDFSRVAPSLTCYHDLLFWFFSRKSASWNIHLYVDIIPLLKKKLNMLSFHVGYSRLITRMWLPASDLITFR